MNAKYIVSFLAVVVLFLVSYVGVAAAGLQVVFGIIIPYLAFLTFVIGFIYRMMDWSRSAVPFRIPTTAGQHKSLPWFKQEVVDCPSNTGGVILRMILEIVTFRSLFRNTRSARGTSHDPHVPSRFVPHDRNDQSAHLPSGLGRSDAGAKFFKRQEAVMVIR